MPDSASLRVQRLDSGNPAQVAQWNGVTTISRFKPGQAVVVLVPNKGSARKPSTHLAAKDAPKGGSAKPLSKPGPTARSRAARSSSTGR